MLTCPACLRANVSCILTCPHAKVPCVLTCQRSLSAYVLTCQHALRDKVPCVLTCLACSRANMPCMLTCSRANVLVLMPLLSVLLPLLLKLYTLLVRIKSLITVFPQQREFIHKPSLLIICRLKKGNIGKMFINYWDVLLSWKLLHQ